MIDVVKNINREALYVLTYFLCQTNINLYDISSELVNEINNFTLNNDILDEIIDIINENQELEEDHDNTNKKDCIYLFDYNIKHIMNMDSKGIVSSVIPYSNINIINKY